MSLRSFRSKLNPFSSHSRSQSEARCELPLDNNSAGYTSPSQDTMTATNGVTPSQPLTIIELYQSQGCDSCPPANDFCIANFPPTDPNYLLLTYEVTYWDHLGWPDTFGDKRWDTRQRDYATAARSRSVYTPQVIVDGGAVPLGSSGWRSLPNVLGREQGPRHNAVSVEVGSDKRTVRVSGDAGVKADVLVVYYEVAPADVRILRGENRGKTLPHRNIVRDLGSIGRFEGGEGVFEVPERREGLEMVVMVQRGRGGEILSAARV
ncbi:thioredoxin-like protein [Xylogone sp. PMI_703]|nr:thioredoxin-like protein [Xylogone sp. PMI_703]